MGEARTRREFVKSAAVTGVGLSVAPGLAQAASGPSDQVVVAVMGTMYAVGSDADEQSLSGKLRSASWPDGAWPSSGRARRRRPAPPRCTPCCTPPCASA